MENNKLQFILVLFSLLLMVASINSQSSALEPFMRLASYDQQIKSNCEENGAGELALSFKADAEKFANCTVESIKKWGENRTNFVEFQCRVFDEMKECFEELKKYSKCFIPTHRAIFNDMFYLPDYLCENKQKFKTLVVNASCLFNSKEVGKCISVINGDYSKITLNLIRSCLEIQAISCNNPESESIIDEIFVYLKTKSSLKTKMDTKVGAKNANTQTSSSSTLVVLILAVSIMASFGNK